MSYVAMFVNPASGRRELVTELLFDTIEDAEAETEVALEDYRERHGVDARFFIGEVIEVIHG